MTTPDHDPARVAGLPKNATGLRLYKIVRERLIACEPVYFVNGWSAVDTVLRRAQLAGRVEIGGEIKDHFADVLIGTNGDFEETVALDRDSYNNLKNHWMRCRLDKESNV